MNEMLSVAPPKFVDGALFSEMADGRLQWLPEIEIGYFPVTDAPSIVYDHAYFQKYVGYESTEIGRRLNTFRCGFVSSMYGIGSPLVDIGVGCGSFIKSRDRIGTQIEECNTFGFDIAETSITWLRSCNRFINPYLGPIPAASFWDSLEHIQDFRPLVANVAEWIFCTIPVFIDDDHVLRSKHFRKDEHFWYFTDRGFRRVMGALGFSVQAYSVKEALIGREDVASYALKRERPTNAVGPIF
jgi:hypothetical protein